MRVLSVLLITASALALLISSPVYAHSRGESYGKWFIDGNEVRLTYTLKLKDVDKMSDAFDGTNEGWQQRVAKHVEDNIQISNEELPCTLQSPLAAKANSAFLQIKGQYSCQGRDQLRISNNAIFDIDSQHIHIARVTLSSGEIKEKVFLSKDRIWQPFQNTEGASGLFNSTFLSYLYIGAEHILLGWDHLAFLAALLLLMALSQARLSHMFLVITGFTIGHSASLVLSLLGYLIPESLIVESMIAFSISLLALEAANLKNKNAWLSSIPLAIALVIYAIGSELWIASAFTSLALLGLALFSLSYLPLAQNQNSGRAQLSAHMLISSLFGFIHGFGFAGSIQELGLPTEQFILALFSFNLGIELGQIFIASIALFFLLKIKLDGKAGSLAVDLSLALLFGLGLFWFIDRSLI